MALWISAFKNFGERKVMLTMLLQQSFDVCTLPVYLRRLRGDVSYFKLESCASAHDSNLCLQSCVRIIRLCCLLWCIQGTQVHSVTQGSVSHRLLTPRPSRPTLLCPPAPLASACLARIPTCSYRGCISFALHSWCLHGSCLTVCIFAESTLVVSACVLAPVWTVFTTNPPQVHRMTSLQHFNNRFS